jgi:hypothetical protein
MPSNKVAFALIFIGLVPLALTMQAIFFSGSDIEEFPLQGKHGETEAVSLQPDMNPLRLIISMDYGMKAFGTAQRYIEYEVTANIDEGRILWIEDGRASVSGDKKFTGDKTHYSSLQTFDVDAPVDVLFSYKIEEANLRYKGGSLTLKRNVTRHNWFLTITGLVLLVSGILIFASNQKKQ